MLTQQSGSLTAQMHHNSQKRINTSKLFWDLGDLILTPHSQKHPSASLCSSVFTTLLIQQYRRTRAPESYLSHFLTSVFTSVPHASACQYYCINAASVSPSSSLHHICSVFIKDYLTIYISSSIINGGEAYWMSFS